MKFKQLFAPVFTPALLCTVFPKSILIFLMHGNQSEDISGFQSVAQAASDLPFNILLKNKTKKFFDPGVSDCERIED